MISSNREEFDQGVLDGESVTKLLQMARCVETNKKPNFELYERRGFITDDCVDPRAVEFFEGQLGFRALLVVPRSVDELIPEWLNVPTQTRADFLGVKLESLFKGKHCRYRAVY